MGPFKKLSGYDEHLSISVFKLAATMPRALKDVNAASE